jgi:hypothetical protein
MKKIVLALSTVLFSAQVFATATLRIPIFIEGAGEPVSAISINQELAAVGAPLIPLYIEISSNEDGYKKMTAIEDSILEALKPLGSAYEGAPMLGGSVPGELDTPEYFTCYTGNALEIPDIVTGLADSVYSDQLTMLGYKFKSTTVYSDNAEESAQYLSDESALWRNWNGKGTDFLMLAATSDGGEDVQESLIPKCH